MSAHPFALLAALAPLIFPALLIVAAVRDVTSYTIPNWISAAAALAFLPAALVMGASQAQLLTALLVGAAGLLLGMLAFALRWVGGGDAKLMAASALWLGWPAVMPFLLFTAVAGGGLAVLLLVGRSRPNLVGAGAPAWFARLMQPKADVPYGLAIAVGALAAFPASALVHSSL